MHPLITYIHPSLRVGLLAWGLGRASLWLWWWAARGAAPVAATTPSEASPGYNLLLTLCELLNMTGWRPLGYAASAWAMTGLMELCALMAVLGVYHLTRRDMTPQASERATWLWALCPLGAPLVQASPLAMAVMCAIAAVSAAYQGRHVWGIALFAGAVCLRLDAMALAPALALASWRAYAPGRDAPWAPWLVTLGALALWPAQIFAATMLSGRLGVSLRTLHPPAWRTSLASLDALSPAGCLALGALGLGLGLGLAQRKQTPLLWWLLAIPLLWPLCFEVPGAQLGCALMGIALVAWVARACEDPARERPAMILGALLCGALVIFGP